MDHGASDPAVCPGDVLVVEHAGLQQLIDAVRQRGYRVIGPTIQNGAIVYDTVTRLDQLPAGWTDRQEPGHYHLERRNDEALFGYAVGPHSWKRFLHPPVEKLWQARREGAGFAVNEPEPEDEPLAFLGVRACELNAIAIQDRVFLQGAYRDPHYRKRRESACIIAVNCGVAGGTCFCASMGSGPKAAGGFDLALTELADDGAHCFLLEVGSFTGADLAATLSRRPATAAEIKAAERIVARTAAAMGRVLDTDGIKELLQGIRAGTMLPRAASPALIARWSARPVFARASKMRAISPVSRPSGCGAGIHALLSIFPTFTAAACGKRPRRAIVSG
jgi:hypothetical protein